MTRSLAGRRLILVRPAVADPDRLLSALRAAGARTTALASTGFAPPVDVAALERARVELAAGGAWDWVVFTSPRAVAALIPDAGVAWPEVAVAAVGSATAAALRAAGRAVALVGVAGAADLGRALAALLPAHARVLQPAGNLAGEDLQQALAAAGARVTRLESYRTVPRPLTAADLAALGEAPDAIVFTSGSGAAALLAGLRSRGSGLPPNARVACLGPRTARDLAALGLRVDLVSPAADGSALVAALAADLAAVHPATDPATAPRAAQTLAPNPRGA